MQPHGRHRAGAGADEPLCRRRDAPRGRRRADRARDARTDARGRGGGAVGRPAADRQPVQRGTDPVWRQRGGRRPVRCRPRCDDEGARGRDARARAAGVRRMPGLPGAERGVRRHAAARPGRDPAPAPRARWCALRRDVRARACRAPHARRHPVARVRARGTARELGSFPGRRSPRARPHRRGARARWGGGGRVRPHQQRARARRPVAPRMADRRQSGQPDLLSPARPRAAWRSAHPRTPLETAVTNSSDKQKGLELPFFLLDRL